MSTTDTTSQDSGGTAQGAEYWQAEAKKAFDARQKAKAEADDLRKQLEARQGIDPDEYKRLKESAEQAEQERARKAGEFDKLKDQLVTRYQADIEARDKKLAEADKRLRDMLVGRAFAEATELFGPSGKTIYVPRAAERIFSEYVRVQDDGSLAVVDANGDIILDPRTARPKPFAEAMGKLIESLPDKDYHLRGSATTGSGSSGGVNTSQKPGDEVALTKRLLQNPKDKDAYDKLKALQKAKGGNITFGSA